MVEVSLKASPTARGEQHETQVGPPTALSVQGHQRKGTALSYAISKLTLSPDSQLSRRGNALLALTKQLLARAESRPRRGQGH